MLCLWLDGRSGRRSAIVGTVIAGGIGALLDAIGVPGYAIAVTVVVLVLPLDLLTYRLDGTSTLVSTERPTVLQPEEEPESKDLKVYAASGSR